MEEGVIEKENSKEQSFKEQRIRAMTKMYYSKPEVQKAIYEFSIHREICPRYFEGFGKRPDSFQYPNDVFELAKRGATSFHASEELWSDPLKIETGMSQEKANELRIGWDLLIDIDSKYIDYSRIMGELILKILSFHGVNNIGIKFSGSKGFHLIVPWKAFPKQINNISTAKMFPEWPRIITNYIHTTIQKELVEKISELERPNKYVKDYQASKEVIPDLVLVSPRHLFRMPYSLHEKTALASVVLTKSEFSNFELKSAEPMKVEIKNFIPNSKEGEAGELLIQALDWHKSIEKKSQDYENPHQEKKQDFKPIQIVNLSEAITPPCINFLLKGINDGKKRGVFILINFFRSLGLDRADVEKKVYEWNLKNKEPLKEGYIKTQIDWSYKRKNLMPPNCREFYKNMGICVSDELCNSMKNPINYTMRKNFLLNKKDFGEEPKKYSKNKKQAHYENEN